MAQIWEQSHWVRTCKYWRHGPYSLRAPTLIRNILTRSVDRYMCNARELWFLFFSTCMDCKLRKGRHVGRPLWGASQVALHTARTQPNTFLPGWTDAQPVVFFISGSEGNIYLDVQERKLSSTLACCKAWSTSSIHSPFHSRIHLIVH